MTGYDVTDEEMKNAEEFLAIGRKWKDPQPEYRISHEMLVRMLAWYASVRVNGDGKGHFEVNGMPIRKRESDEAI